MPAPTTTQAAKPRASGVVSLGLDYVDATPPRCEGKDRGWLASFHEGAQVIVRAGEETVGVGSLSAGTAQTDRCDFAFEVAAVEPGRGFYTITIGAAQPYTLSEDDLAAPIGMGFGL
ncbi:hypothetical protein CH298_04340 [Rhodococcoides fascians]|nr:hypothetical protein CH303_04335 [Rhodococcus fascians]OZF23368.1 hypothetical protein CH298_04340 [Rhodococcus fascians]OZF25081.1 hypothetical protein CH297_04335 [Rhodococcus fascians]OZF72677.1 hypothetical protein CH308_04340 [Rhodococcus fascians]OZF73976.1 hypothetical protein CH307_04340 [Rhodococcus fascians]